jgi:hypothetical protein
MVKHGSFQGLGARRDRDLKRAAKAAQNGAGPYSKQAAPFTSRTAVVHSKAAAMIMSGAMRPPPPPIAKVSMQPPVPAAKVSTQPPVPAAKVSMQPPVPAAKVSMQPPAVSAPSSPEYDPFTEVPELDAAASSSSAAILLPLSVEVDLQLKMARVSFLHPQVPRTWVEGIDEILQRHEGFLMIGGLDAGLEVVAIGIDPNNECTLCIQWRGDAIIDASTVERYFS